MRSERTNQDRRLANPVPVRVTLRQSRPGMRPEFGAASVGVPGGYQEQTARPSVVRHVDAHVVEVVVERVPQLVDPFRKTVIAVVHLVRPEGDDV